MRGQGSRRKGHAGIGLMIWATMILVFVVLPLFTVLFEKTYATALQATLHNQVQAALQEAAGALRVESLPVGHVLYSSEVEAVFTEALRRQMRLDPQMRPQPGSIADGAVVIVQVEAYGQGDLPWVDCRGGNQDRPGIEVVLQVPVEPHFYRQQLAEEGTSQVGITIQQVYTVPINR